MLRASGFVVVAVVLATGCTAPEPTPEAQPEPERVRFDDALHDDLVAMQAADQAIREVLTAKGWENISEQDVARQEGIDSDNTERLAAIIDEHGWPTRALVGEDGVDAAFLIVQHADLAFQKRVLPLVREAFAADEITGQELALLTDRIRVREGKPQLFGTQAGIVDGELVFDPIEDEANVDARRAELGLPSMDEYRAVLEKAYGLQRELT